MLIISGVKYRSRNSRQSILATGNPSLGRIRVGDTGGCVNTFAPHANLPILCLLDYSQIITIEPGKRSGKPCIRGLRITVYDVLDYLSSGMTHEEILADFPYLTDEDIRACLAFAADRERKTAFLAGEAALR